MIRMAYITPSASPPQIRMRTTSRPIPAPKIQQPGFVTGEVTRSVAMYTAPSISPPEKSMNAASGYRGWSQWSPVASTPTVAKMLAGIRQLR
ncbi:MAG: hypothetical protein A3H48_04235 [Candidatus Rokubacteria bacterium RIFCSPLOWO2_02_FULL_71_18]|nr:MAG: hypothetical protein A3H48_04235 [Candidatus Rokubacteria bacterium RIFCSPLOWO2_02_FULL_71_18]